MPLHKSGDDWHFCPYDKSHIVLSKGLSSHLVNCPAKHKHKKMKCCPFDYYHVYPESEMKRHVLVCDKRYLQDRKLPTDDPGPRGAVQGPPIVADHLAKKGVDHQNQENWDSLPQNSTPTPAVFNETAPSGSTRRSDREALKNRHMSWQNIPDSPATKTTTTTNRNERFNPREVPHQVSPGKPAVQTLDNIHPSPGKDTATSLETTQTSPAFDSNQPGINQVASTPKKGKKKKKKTLDERFSSELNLASPEGANAPKAEEESLFMLQRKPNPGRNARKTRRKSLESKPESKEADDVSPGTESKSMPADARTAETNRREECLMLLREISLLEQKVLLGHELTPLQKSKLQRKDEVTDFLSSHGQYQR